MLLHLQRLRPLAELLDRCACRRRVFLQFGGKAAVFDPVNERLVRDLGYREFSVTAPEQHHMSVLRSAAALADQLNAALARQRSSDGMFLHCFRILMRAGMFAGKPRLAVPVFSTSRWRSLRLEQAKNANQARRGGQGP